MHHRLPSFLLALVLCPAPAVVAQDSSVARLETVVVEVTRGPRQSPLELPYAISVTRPDSSRPGQRHLSLEETLAIVPGLAVSNRNNPSQDPRISIRGFGARSAFGVRGIRVLRDGIPLTLPDGQTPVDYLDLESVGRVEILRGSASSLYGNAGGGVIHIRSTEPSGAPLLTQARWWAGSFGNRRLVGKLSGSVAPFSYLGNVAHTVNDGFRDYARQRVTTAFARTTLGSETNSLAAQFLGMRMPLAENPGALTAEQMATNPRAADAVSIRKRARKIVSQSQVGVTARHHGVRGEIETSAYAGTRALDNPLAFAVVEVDRTSSGAGLRAGVPHSVLGLSQLLIGGIEAQLQNDKRRNFANCNDIPPPTLPTPACPAVGEERGVVTLDQREIVSSVGAYLRDELRAGNALTLSAGVRADRVRFRVEDQLVDAANPDDSGERSLGAVSPMFGLVARILPTHSIYANFSTSFETPTATELGNQPSGAAGLNRELQPQRSRTYELGANGVAAAGLQYNAAIFATSVFDELIPFDIPGGNGRRYFRNAGRTSRRGLELGAAGNAGPLQLTAAYTYARYRFTDFVVGTAQFAGNRIPGLPPHLLQAGAAVRADIGTFVAEAIAADRMFVNDANSDAAPGYALFNVRLNSAKTFGRAGAEITAGIQNLFDRRYASSVSVNAAAGKYFEPAQERSIYLGLSFSAASRALR